MQARAAGVGKHIQYVALRFGAAVGGVSYFIYFFSSPFILSSLLYFGKIVFHIINALFNLYRCSGKNTKINPYAAVDFQNSLYALVCVAQ